MTRDQILEFYHQGPEAVVALVEGLLAKVADLERQNEELTAKAASLERDSTNSNKPPSSDGLQKKRGSPKRGSSGRKPGGQKGHVGKTYEPAPPEDITHTIPHKPTECENCGHTFSDTDPCRPVERRQVLEIPEIEPEIHEHVFSAITCPCGHQTRLAVPSWIRSGTGENLEAHLAYLTGVTKLSRRTVQQVLAELFGVPRALGTVQNRLEDTSEALEPIYQELEDALCEHPTTNIDETSYPHNGKLHWLWAFVTQTFAFFAIRASRGSKVLKEILGLGFAGIIICDRFSAYVKYQKDRPCGLIQFCWAHLIRDVKGLGHAAVCGGQRLFSRVARQRIGALFRVWHTFKRGELSRAELIEKVQPHLEKLRTLLEENLKSSTKPVRTLCKGLLDKWESLFTFLYHEGVEPTNNLAERMIRPAVQTRKISHGTRSEGGQVLLARLLTVSQTCRMQGRNPLEFSRAAIRAKREGLPFPSLLHAPAKDEQRMRA